MNRKLRYLLAALISLAPFNGLRRLLYNSLLGYQIAPTATIGWRTAVVVSRFKVDEGVIIGRENIFRGPIDVHIAARARIGRRNRFACAWQAAEPRLASRGYKPALYMGEGSLVLDMHELDLYGTVRIGAGSLFAGSGSQVWTHGLTVMDRDITIGANNYIGASSRFGPGSSLGNDNVVALGSVVLSKNDVDFHLIAGVPARPIRSIREDVEAGRYHRSLGDY